MCQSAARGRVCRHVAGMSQGREAARRVRGEGLRSPTPSPQSLPCMPHHEATVAGRRAGFCPTRPAHLQLRVEVLHLQGQRRLQLTQRLALLAQLRESVRMGARGRGVSERPRQGGAR